MIIAVIKKTFLVWQITNLIAVSVNSRNACTLIAKLAKFFADVYFN
jgi:hypothetical protein